VSRFLLDTNIPSEINKPHPEPSVLRWLGMVEEAQTLLSVVSLGEMRKGCELLKPGSKLRLQLEHWLEHDIPKWLAGRILLVIDTIAHRWGELDAKRQRLGMPLNIADGMIAATALEHGLTIVTRNVEDFRELGVEIIDPFEGHNAALQ